jgi:hypothetical protein
MLALILREERKLKALKTKSPRKYFNPKGIK